MKRLLKLILIILLPAQSFAMTIDELIMETYKNNQGIKSLKDSLKAEETKLIDAYATWLPNLSFSTTKSSQKSYIEDKMDFGRSLKNKTNTFSLNQPIFNNNGGANFFIIGQAQTEINIAKNEYIKKEQEIFLRAINNYIDIMKFREHLKLASKNVEVHSKYLEMMSEKFKSGTATIGAEAKSRTRLAQARTRLTQTQGQLSNAIINFETTTGPAPEKLEFPKLELIKEPSEELTALALEHNPELLVVQNQEKLESYRKKQSLMKLAPRVYLTAQYSKNNNNPIHEAMPDYKSHSRYVGVTAEIPIVAPAIWTEIRRSHLRQASSENSYESAKGYVTAQIMANYNQYRTSLISLESNNEAVSAQQTDLDAMKQGLEFGTESITAVLDSEAELFKVRTELIEARGEIVKSYFRIKAAVGELNSIYIGLDEEKKKG